MMYYREAPVGVDLNYRFDERTERGEDEDEHLDGICEALQNVLEKGAQGERKGGIITWRGMITRWVFFLWGYLQADGRIMTAPFEHRDEEKWEMTAIALDGSVYVELHDPPDVRKERRNRQSAHAIQSYMGYSYESFSTVAAPDKVEEKFEGQHESWSGDVNTNVQVCPSIPV
jgi:RAT1-interacting protein